jgi:hypothetical protein
MLDFFCKEGALLRRFELLNILWLSEPTDGGRVGEGGVSIMVELA